MATTKIELIESKDGLQRWCVGKASTHITIPSPWRSPRIMPAWAARHFAQVVDVKPERLDLHSLSPAELALEGGEAAYDYLWKHDGLWMFRYELRKLPNPSEVKKALNE